MDSTKGRSIISEEVQRAKKNSITNTRDIQHSIMETKKIQNELFKTNVSNRSNKYSTGIKDSRSSTMKSQNKKVPTVSVLYQIYLTDVRA